MTCLGFDYSHDSTVDGKSLCCLTVIDEFTREGLAIEVARSLTSGDAKRVLDHLFEIHGIPEFIRSDNVLHTEVKLLAVDRTHCAASWLEEYNTIRPHGAIGLETPAAYSERLRRALKQAV